MNTAASRSHNTSNNGRAFTLVELLIVLAIIFLLISFAFMAFGKARKSASRLESLNALRQMMTAYTGYSNEHKGRFMPGYINPSSIGTGPNQLDIKAKLQNGFQLTAADTAPYVWRLAPYLDHAWKTYMVDYRSSSLDSLLNLEFGDGSASGAYGPGSINGNQYGIGLRPSFGLNSVCVGGDSFHGGSALTNYSPWNTQGNKSIAAVRMSEVKYPTKLIVFGSTQYATQSDPPASPLSIPLDPQTSVRLGYPELRAPMLGFQAPDNTTLPTQWTLETSGDGRVQYSGGGLGGVPIDRLNQDMLNIGFLDGSVGTEAISRLAKDMSRWSPFALSTQ